MDDHTAYLDERWLDRAVDWLDTHDAHAYILVEEEERRFVTERFGLNGYLGRLDYGPAVVYKGEARTFDHGVTRSATVSRTSAVPALALS